MIAQIKIKPGVPGRMDASDTPTYDRWLARVDHILVKYAGVSLHDLPDCPYRDWYDGRARPVRAANRALRYAQDC